MICSCLRILHLPKAKTARTKSRFDRDGKARSHCHTLRNPASGSRQEPPKPLCPTLFLDERILRADSGQERTTAGRCPVTHGSRPTFDQYTGFASGERKSAREKKRTFFRRAIGWESFPARRQAGTSSLQTAGNGQNGSDFASRPTGPLSTDGKQAPHKEAINEKQKIMEKKQSTALEKADTATLTLSILFVVSILCTILFSLTA